MQLTHRSNYRTAGDALGYDYVSDPDVCIRYGIIAPFDKFSASN